jgi:hypothetical protein
VCGSRGPWFLFDALCGGPEGTRRSQEQFEASCRKATLAKQADVIPEEVRADDSGPHDEQQPVTPR